MKTKSFSSCENSFLIGAEPARNRLLKVEPEWPWSQASAASELVRKLAPEHQPSIKQSLPRFYLTMTLKAVCGGAFGKIAWSHAVKMVGGLDGSDVHDGSAIDKGRV